MTEEMNDQAVQEEVDQLEVEINEAFETAVGAGKAEDDVKLAMIGAGATFKNVTRLYNKFMIDAGFAISKADRDMAVASIVGDPAMLADEEYYTGCVEAIVEQIKGATERAAGAMLRAFAKLNDVACYSKPKSEGTRQEGFRFKLYAALRANFAMTEAECEAFMKDPANLASENDLKSQSHFQAIRKLCNDAYAK